jgi:hypothetical protein
MMERINIQIRITSRDFFWRTILKRYLKWEHHTVGAQIGPSPPEALGVGESSTEEIRTSLEKTQFFFFFCPRGPICFALGDCPRGAIRNRESSLNNLK